MSLRVVWKEGKEVELTFSHALWLHQAKVSF